MINMVDSPDCYIKVTNGNDFPISDRYDGVPYDFEPKKPLNIPADAAYHIFGARQGASDEDMFRHFTKRAGWNVPDKVKQAQAWFKKIKLEPVFMKRVEVPLTEFEQTAA